MTRNDVKWRTKYNLTRKNEINLEYYGKCKYGDKNSHKCSTFCWNWILTFKSKIYKRDVFSTNVECLCGFSILNLPRIEPHENWGSIHHTGHSLSETLLLASINLKYDNRLFVELQVQYKKTACCVHLIVVVIQNNLMYTLHIMRYT